MPITLDLKEMKAWRAEAPDFLYADDLRPAAEVFRRIDSLILALETAQSDLESIRKVQAPREPILLKAEIKAVLDRCEQHTGVKRPQVLDRAMKKLRLAFDER